MLRFPRTNPPLWWKLHHLRKHFSPTEQHRPRSFRKPTGYSEAQLALHPSGPFMSHSLAGQGPALGWTLLQEPGGGSGTFLGPRRALLPDRVGMSAFRDPKAADLHTSLEVTLPVNKQTWFYFNKVIQSLLVMPKLAILRFLQTAEISF